MHAEIDSQPTTEANPTPAREVLPVRLAFGGVLWRVTLVAFLIRTFVAWRWLRRAFRWARLGRRLGLLLLYTPRQLYYSFLIGTGAAIATDLFVRLVLRPLVWRWYTPSQSELEIDSPLPFHLGAHETILAEMPARRKDGRWWRPGTLVLTSARLGFIPFTWDAEPWLIPVAHIAGVFAAPAPQFGFGLVRGLPDRLVVRDLAGTESRLAVADPEMLLDWLDAHDHAPDLRRP